MAEGNKILGKVAFVDKGAYNAGARYDLFNFVTTEDSCYLSLKDGNTGHPVTDTAWWKCIANGKSATEAAKKALAEATRQAMRPTTFTVPHSRPMKRPHGQATLQMTPIRLKQKPTRRPDVLT